MDLNLNSASLTGVEQTFQASYPNVSDPKTSQVAHSLTHSLTHSHIPSLKSSIGLYTEKAAQYCLAKPYVSYKCCIVTDVRTSKGLRGLSHTFLYSKHTQDKCCLWGLFILASVFLSAFILLLTYWFLFYRGALTLGQHWCVFRACKSGEESMKETWEGEIVVGSGKSRHSCFSAPLLGTKQSFTTVSVRERQRQSQQTE